MAFQKVPKEVPDGSEPTAGKGHESYVVVLKVSAAELIERR